MPSAILYNQFNSFNEAHSGQPTSQTINPEEIEVEKNVQQEDKILKSESVSKKKPLNDFDVYIHVNGSLLQLSKCLNINLKITFKKTF